MSNLTAVDRTGGGQSLGDTLRNAREDKRTDPVTLRSIAFGATILTARCLKSQSEAEELLAWADGLNAGLDIEQSQ